MNEGRNLATEYRLSHPEVGKLPYWQGIAHYVDEAYHQGDIPAEVGEPTWYAVIEVLLKYHRLNYFTNGKQFLRDHAELIEDFKAATTA